MNKALFPFVAGIVLGIVFLTAGRGFPQAGWSSAEQDFSAARAALAAAREVRGDQYAPKLLERAEELLASAGKARSEKDTVKFSQASRLSRAYADGARSTALLRAEEDRLAQARAELQKARAELEAVKRGR